MAHQGEEEGTQETTVGNEQRISVTSYHSMNLKFQPSLALVLLHQHIPHPEMKDPYTRISPSSPTPRAPKSTHNDKMTRELTLHFHPHHHTALTLALYGPEHGSGEHTLNLLMTSAQPGFTIRMPVLCRYESNVPVLIATCRDKDDWDTFVETDGRVEVDFA